MAGGIEVAQAYVSIIPSMRGIQGEISDAIGAEKIGDEAGKEMGSGIGTGLSTAKVALGNIIGNMAMDAANEFKERFSDGIAQSDALQKFASTMEFAGLDSGQISAVRDEMKSYADQTVYDLGEVMDTTAKLAANGVTDFDTLVQAAGNLNAAAGGNSESFGYLANAITQVNGAGKLMASDWNQIVNALPGASGAIQDELKEMGAWDESMGSFKDAMAGGEISAEEFNAALTNLGMTDVAQQAATSTTTFEGAMGQLDAAVTNTMQSIYDSLNEDGRITDAINSMSTAFEAISPYVSAVADAFGDFVEFVSPAIPVIAGVVAGIAGMSVITSIVGAIGGFVTAAGTAIGMIGSLPGLIAVITTVLGGPVTIIAAIVGAIVAFIATNDEARNAVIGVWNQIKDTFTTVMGVVVPILSAAWESIKSTVTSALSVVSGVVSSVLGTVKTTFQNIWDAIKTLVQNAIDRVKSTIDSISTIVANVRSTFQSVKDAIMNPINQAKDAVSGAIGRIKDIVNNAHLSLPHFKLPHFRINGGELPWGIGGKGSPPSIGVDWYARGGYVDGATLIGVGERGGEFIWPSYDPYLDHYAEALASHINGTGNNIYIDGARVNDDAAIQDAMLNLFEVLQRRGAMNVGTV